MERSNESLRVREGAALLCLGITAAIQSLLVVGVVYFANSRAAPDAAPTLRPSIHH